MSGSFDFFFAGRAATGAGDGSGADTGVAAGNGAEVPTGPVSRDVSGADVRASSAGDKGAETGATL